MWSFSVAASAVARPSSVISARIARRSVGCGRRRTCPRASSLSTALVTLDMDVVKPWAQADVMLTGGAEAETFQPMNVNFGLMPPIPGRSKKTDRKRAYTDRARSASPRRIVPRSECCPPMPAR